MTAAEEGAVAYISAALIYNDDVRAALAAIVDDGGIPINAHHIKPLIRALASRGIELRRLDIDTELAAYLIDPADSRYALDALLLRHLQIELASDSAAAAGQLDFDGDDVDSAQIAGREALGVHALAPALAEMMDSRHLRALYDDIERPLVRVLANMEDLGVGVDLVELTRLRDHLVSECDRFEAEITAAAGHEFNVNSTKQLREVLFEELGLTPQKKTKPDSVPTQLRSRRSEISTRSSKLYFLIGRSKSCARPTGRDCSMSLVQMSVFMPRSTNGRANGSPVLGGPEPSQHPGPHRTGSRVSPRFHTRSGTPVSCRGLQPDRATSLAHLAEDPGLVGAFERGQDIHNTTASSIFGVEPGAVTIEQRSKAKMVSYGLAYGDGGLRACSATRHTHRRKPPKFSMRISSVPMVRSFMDRVVARSQAARLHRDRIRTPPSDPRAGVSQLPGKTGCRTPSDERSYSRARR